MTRRKASPVQCVKLCVILLMIWQPACAQEATITISETQIKSAIEEMAVLYICSDSRLLEAADMDAQKCAIGVSVSAEGCWEIIDKLEPNYELAGNESGKEQFASISDVYNHCAQAELLMWVVLSRANQK